MGRSRSLSYLKLHSARVTIRREFSGHLKLASLQDSWSLTLQLTGSVANTPTQNFGLDSLNAVYSRCIFPRLLLGSSSQDILTWGQVSPPRGCSLAGMASRSPHTPLLRPFVAGKMEGKTRQRSGGISWAIEISGIERLRSPRRRAGLSRLRRLLPPQRWR